MTIYADAHVHFYRCFDLERLLHAAGERARALDGPLLLLLCESHGYDYFGALRAHARGEAASAPPNLTPALLEAFAPSTTGEPASLRLGDVWLVAGHQLVSEERIEVLALAADPDAGLGAVADGSLPARELRRRRLDSGALAVLPWGVGKWLGERGRRVEALLGDAAWADHPRLFAGDIAQRCAPWPEPAAFARGPRVLAGSDVLPVPGAEARTAGYGFRVAGEIDAGRPAASLRRALEDGARVEPFGRREGLVSTVREQLRHRLHGGDTA
ncbi:MAG: hypothetical protein ACQGVC_18635 [Myxococcota bacterium]